MNTYRLGNITLDTFREYLTFLGCHLLGVKGGHEKWTKEGIKRPVIFQTHFKTIPEFILRNNLAILGKSRNDFIDWLKNK